MKIKYERPDYVKSFVKPKNTEIKKIGNYWYLYERTTKYDPVTKKSRKVSGKMLGKITENGFVAKKVKSERLLEIETLELGASSYFYYSNRDILEQLKIFFPNNYNEIFAISVLRLIYGGAFKRISLHYETSYLSKLIPNLKLSSATISRLLEDIGKNRASIKNFMNSQNKESKRFILFDGHKIISDSKSLDIADKGYDSKKRYKNQFNVIYVFSIDETTYYPEYYKNFNGSIPDITAFEDIFKESNIKGDESILIADKGFNSKYNIELINNSNLNYIMPLKRGSVEIKNSIPNSTTQYTDVFKYNDRTIYSKEFNKEEYSCHLFLDTELLNDETSCLVDRINKKNKLIKKAKEVEIKNREKGLPKLSDYDFENLNPIKIMDAIKEHKEMGTITLKTNIDLPSKVIYEIYKKRQAIEQFFKTYDDELGFNKSYMRNDYSLEGWLFLNHISSLITIRFINEIDKLGKLKDISFKDSINLLKKIKTSKVDGKFYVNKIPKKSKDFCTKIGIEIEC